MTSSRLDSGTQPRSDGAKRLRLTINGHEYDVASDSTARLLDVLRNDLGLTGTKEGCGIGVCGTCTILVDDVAMTACLMLVGSARGRRIETIEGVADGGDLHPLQSSFVKAGGLQCGFCTPGQIMAALALLRDRPEPTDSQITEAMLGNLCRCTGYYKIRDAIKQAAAHMTATHPYRKGTRSA